MGTARQDRAGHERRRATDPGADREEELHRGVARAWPLPPEDWFPDIDEDLPEAEPIELCGLRHLVGNQSARFHSSTRRPLARVTRGWGDLRKTFTAFGAGPCTIIGTWSRSMLYFPAMMLPRNTFVDMSCSSEPQTAPYSIKTGG